MEQGASIEKIADVQGYGNGGLDLIGKCINLVNNLVKVDIDCMESSIKSILECLDIPEKQNVAKDQLIDNLNHCMIILSETLGQCSGEVSTKISQGLGDMENPYELGDDDEVCLSDCPQGNSPDAKEVSSLLP